jgi:hypothetical protein
MYKAQLPGVERQSHDANESTDLSLVEAVVAVGVRCVPQQLQVTAATGFALERSPLVHASGNGDALGGMKKTRLSLINTYKIYI